MKSNNWSSVESCAIFASGKSKRVPQIKATKRVFKIRRRA